MCLGKEAFIASLSLCVELVQRHHSFKIIVLYVCPLYLFWDFKVAGPFPFLRFWGCYQCSGLGWCHWCGYPAAGWHGAIRIPSSCLPQAFWYVFDTVFVHCDAKSITQEFAEFTSCYTSYIGNTLVDQNLKRKISQECRKIAERQNMSFLSTPNWSTALRLRMLGKSIRFWKQQIQSLELTNMPQLTKSWSESWHGECSQTPWDPEWAWNRKLSASVCFILYCLLPSLLVWMADVASQPRDI